MDVENTNKTINNNGNITTLSYAEVFNYTGDNKRYQNALVSLVHQPRYPAIHYYTGQTSPVIVKIWNNGNRLDGTLIADYRHLTVSQHGISQLTIEWCKVVKVSFDFHHTNAFYLKVIEFDQHQPRNILFNNATELRSFVHDCVERQFLYRTKYMSGSTTSGARTSSSLIRNNRLTLSLANAVTRVAGGSSRKCYKSNWLMFASGEQQQRPLNGR